MTNLTQQKSLSDEDKHLIKQAVLNAVTQGCLEPELLAKRCIDAFEIINRYDPRITSGSTSTAP